MRDKFQSNSIGLKAELEKIADLYHQSQTIQDKKIEGNCQRFFCHWLLERLDSTESVVELGYGDGITTDMLSPHIQNYEVVEGVSSLVGEAKRRAPGVKVIESLFEDFCPDRQFDTILAFHVLEHVRNPDALLKHLKTWLKKTGRIFVLVPNALSLHRQLALSMGLIDSVHELSDRDHLVGHLRVYSPSQLVSQIEDCGFKIITEKGFFIKPFPNSMMLEHADELIEGLNHLGLILPPEYGANYLVEAVIK